MADTVPLASPVEDPQYAQQHSLLARIHGLLDLVPWIVVMIAAVLIASALSAGFAGKAAFNPERVTVTSAGLSDADLAAIVNATAAANAAARGPTDCRMVQFYIADLYSDANVPRATVVDAVKAIEKAINRDFSPVWGQCVTLNLLARGVTAVPTPAGSAAVYLVDAFGASALQLLFATTGSFTAFHGNAGVGIDGGLLGAGPQPSTYVASLQAVPSQHPYAMVPYGSALMQYGIAKNVNNNALGRGFTTIGQALGHALSHEIMEILGNAGTYYAQKPTADGLVVMWAREVCDPVERGPNSYYTEAGVPISNFVLPAYFSWANGSAQSYDYLGTGAKALTPYGGTQAGLELNLVTGCLSRVVLDSPWDAPLALAYTNVAPLNLACFAASAAAADTSALTAAAVAEASVEVSSA